MKAIVLVGQSSVEYRELPVSILPAQWARIKVESAGLCGTDIAKMTGRSLPVNHTRILGHEFVGKLVGLNGEHNEIRLGEGVVCIPILPCGECDPCFMGRSNLCVKAEAIGRTVQGAFAEYVDVPLENLVKISAKKIFDSYTLADPLAVCLHAYNLSLLKSPSEKYLVVGDGVIGCLMAWLLIKRGFRVSVEGKHDNNLRFIEKFGADSVEIGTRPRYYHKVFEAVGRSQPEALDECFRAVRAGGEVVVIGVYESGYSYPLVARNIFINEVQLFGVNGYTLNEFKEAVSLISSYEEELAVFISHSFSLAQFSRALEVAKNKQGFTMKIVVKPEVCDDTSLYL